MEIRGYINILWRRKAIIILTAAVTLVVVAIGTYLATPVYEALSVLRVATSTGTQAISSVDYMYTDRLMNTYVEIATSRPVIIELIQRLGLNQPPSIKAEIVPNTELIKITVEHTNPQIAATAANTLAEILIAQSNQLYSGGEKSSQEILGEQLAQMQSDIEVARQDYEKLLIQTPEDTEKIRTASQSLALKQKIYETLLQQYEQARVKEAMRANMVTIVESAVVPQAPAKPRVALNYVLGLLVGLVGGIGLAFIFENLDTTLYTVDEIESVTELHTLAKIPKASKKQIDISQDGSSPVAEAFRNLAANIQLIDHQQPRKVLLFMSAEPKQGKSMIVSNLAFALAEEEKKVVVVDCDMRLPKIHSLFHLSNQYGLKDVLERKTGLIKSLQKSQSGSVTVLTSGPLSDHPSQLLASPQMAKLIEKLSQKFDYVLLDTPAFLAVADIAGLAHYVDGLILVVRRAHARREAVQAVGKFLALFPDKVIGRIVNQTDDNINYSYYQNRRNSDSHTILEKLRSLSIFRWKNQR